MHSMLISPFWQTKCTTHPTPASSGYNQVGRKGPTTELNGHAMAGEP